MRQTLAALLVAVFGFSPVAPALLAGDLNLPACCRRLGAHHCAMANAGAQGASFVQQRCLQFPSGSATLTASALTSVPPSRVIFSAIVSHPTAHNQTEPFGRIAFSRSRQKRGPPSFFS